jgi:transcriptional regulator with GAF, ATPase, and Fis domain
MQELSEFQKSMVPLAREAVLTGISYREVADNLMYTLIVVAVEESQGNQTVAARRLGLSSPYVSGVMAGKSLVKARRAKHPVKAT